MFQFTTVPFKALYQDILQKQLWIKQVQQIVVLIMLKRSDRQCMENELRLHYSSRSSHFKASFGPISLHRAYLDLSLHSAYLDQSVYTVHIWTNQFTQSIFGPISLHRAYLDQSFYTVQICWKSAISISKIKALIDCPFRKDDWTN